MWKVFSLIGGVEGKLFAVRLPGCDSEGSHLQDALLARPNALRFSCRLAAFANANEIRVVVDSKTQKSSDLARRKAVNCNRLLGRSSVFGFVIAILCPPLLRRLTVVARVWSIVR